MSYGCIFQRGDRLKTSESDVLSRSLLSLTFFSAVRTPCKVSHNADDRGEGGGGCRFCINPIHGNIFASIYIFKLICRIKILTL